jgi:branched-chain amino acid transport system substrate-binding protein
LINTLKNRENLNQQKLDELKASWKREGGRDPEALIYINNAKAQIQQSKDKPVKTIAVAVPLSNSVSFSQGIGTEILRGVAQVQETANNNNENLQVLIANDKNDPDPQNGAAVAVANDVATRGVLAVIGHYSSGVTKVVLPIYEQHGLTMISPTSTASDLSVWGSEPDHVFLELHLQLKMLPYN